MGKRGHWQICSHCNGDGTHSHRFGAMSMERFQEVFDDEESQQAYFNGEYDQPCERCDGTGKILVSDEPEDVEAAEFAAATRAQERYWQNLEAYACGERD